MTTDLARHPALTMVTRLVGVAALLLGALATAVPAAAQSPIPQLTLWEAQMLSYGQAACDYLAQPHTFDEYLTHVYYDAERVFYQIAAYTGNPAWNACAQRAEAIYRDQYVLPATGDVPGYWNFTHGLAMDYLKTGDAVSKNAVILLSENASYAGDSIPLEWTQSAALSREVAYAIMSYLNAEAVGAPPRARLPQLVDQALGHIDQWFISQTYRCPSDCDPPEAVGQYYIQPFMAGLTSSALIMYFEKTGDARVLPAIKTALDWLWANAWIATAQAFWYDNLEGSPAPDLNLLIAPAFAWVYKQTGDATYRDRGDLVFAGGVLNAYLGSGKQFDQNYAWSFDYVKWRGGGASPPPPPPPPPPTGTLLVAITQPRNGTSVSGTPWAVIWITGATGAANGVTLTLGGRTVGSTTSASPGPISLPYNSTLAADGGQMLTASVRDASGNTGTGSVSVTVGNGATPPPPPAPLTASITAPAAGATVSGTTTVTMSAAGGTSPYTYTLALDATTLVSGGAASYAWNTTATTDASHTLTLTVRDGAGATATAARTVTVANAAPPPPPTGILKVFVTQPTNGTTVSGTAWAVVWINGATGSSNSVTLTLGGRTVGSTTSGSAGPISLPYDTRLAADGAQTLTASARDASGNTGTGSVSVTVSNGGTPPPAPPPVLTAAITAPAAGATVSGTTTVTMAASGGTSPYTYTLALDATTLVSGGAASYAWNTTATADASHTLTLTVRDGAGATATATRTVTVANAAPPPPPPPTGTLQVFVTQPRSGTTVGGTAWIVIWLSGAQGTANVYTVSVNGQTVATQTTSSTGPVSLPWVTTGTPNGPQSFQIFVRDASGNTGTATVTVTVAN